MGYQAPTDYVQIGHSLRMKRRLFWALLPLGLLAQGAAIGAIVFFALRSFDPAFVTRDRAWIEPKSITLGEPVRLGQPIRLEVAYTNAGKAPAQDAMGRYQIEVVSGASFDNRSVESSIEADQVCRQAGTNSGAGVIYPSATRQFDFTFRDPRYADRLNAADNALVFEMCISYKTLNAVHHSAFCYFYRPKRQSVLEMELCQAGQHAD